MSNPYMEKDIKAWQREVYDDAGHIDPENQHYWRSLCYGYMIGRGNDHDEAEDYMRECDKRGLL